ncbi:hypothetical protein AAFC00_003326 [Neodothiora populina]|uniref:Uncharacterized protein n=1 Tax=Neodothiora populina TaxID=2781224 RepID=A0ABR3PA15_9PEZI
MAPGDRGGNDNDSNTDDPIARLETFVDSLVGGITATVNALSGELQQSAKATQNVPTTPRDIELEIRRLQLELQRQLQLPRPENDTLAGSLDSGMFGRGRYRSINAVEEERREQTSRSPYSEANNAFADFLGSASDSSSRESCRPHDISRDLEQGPRVMRNMLAELASSIHALTDDHANARGTFSDFRGSGSAQVHGAVGEDARQAARAILLQARNANTDISTTKRILDLYRDGDDDDTSLRFGSSATRGLGSSRWLGIDWFRKNAYSPLQLENQFGTMWRAAFEDLLAASLDKEQTAKEVYEKKFDNKEMSNAWNAPGASWMLGLQCRGLLPPQLPSLYSIPWSDRRQLDSVFSMIISGMHTRTPYGEAVKRDFEQLAKLIGNTELGGVMSKTTRFPETELDMYEHLMGSSRQKDGESGSEQRNQEESKPSVVSTMTTTETSNMPDGTTKTRKVLMKRFGDGREETSEEVIFGAQENQAGSKMPVTDEKEEEKGGWFWRS